MIYDILRLLFEYISIITCMYKVANEKLNVNGKMICFTITYWILVFVGRTEAGFGILTYVYLLIYARCIICEKWKNTIKTVTITLVIITCLQIIFYLLISKIFLYPLKLSVSAIVSNILVCLMVNLWKKDFWDIISDNVNKIGLIAFIVFGIWILYTINILKRTGKMSEQLLIQLIISLVVLIVFIILWISTEKKKQKEAEELRAYQLYTDTFKDTIKAIRMKQHEFDNHINAIMYMNNTAIAENETLINEKNKYCEDILSDNEFNKLLKMNMSPIISAYLYSKFTAAKTEENIKILYDIEDVNTENIISVSHFIEITGILFDNAVEALKVSQNKIIKVNMGYNENEKFVLRVANLSRRYSNSEIEEFFKFGHSTKGENRGVGLKRVKELAKKYKADICVKNKEYDGNNFLEFEIIFKQNK